LKACSKDWRDFNPPKRNNPEENLEDEQDRERDLAKTRKRERQRSSANRVQHSTGR
jgi:hypothetical protein